MHEHDVLVFLLSLAVLLSAARLLGEISRRLGFPLVFGELASGILLGPTVLGRAWPGGQHWLFPGGPPQTMLTGYTDVAVVLLLVVAGRIAFLLLMPPRAHDQEVRILAQIARAVIEAPMRARLLEAASLAEVLTRLSEHRPRAESTTRRSASLADI